MAMRLAALPGDGIGPEVTDAALRVLTAATGRFGASVEFEKYPVGWEGYRVAGAPLPPETEQAVRRADAVFLGAVGDPRADELPPALRPESGLLRLRKLLDCYANLRPTLVLDPLVETSPLRAERIRGTDFLIVRELASGLYYGEPRGINRDRDDVAAVNTLRYRASEIRRVAHVAFEAARERDRRVVSVDKANVLEASRLWREVVADVGSEYPDIELEHMLVDRAAMELVLRPRAFDVILTENLFGDILSDEAAGVAGSIGLLPSACLGPSAALYEPVHGSAPDIAGQGIANPIAAILSVALLFHHTAGRPEIGAAIEKAVHEVLYSGMRPADLARPGERASGTREITASVCEALRAG